MKSPFDHSQEKLLIELLNHKPEEASESIATEQRVQIIFEFFKQQREEYRSLAQERSSITLQLLILLGALAAIFFQATVVAIQVGISVLIVIIGIIGLIIYDSLNKSSKAHVRRARAARRALRFLEEFIDHADDFGRPYDYYRWIYILIIIVGLLAAISVLS